MYSQCQVSSTENKCYQNSEVIEIIGFTQYFWEQLKVFKEPMLLRKADDKVGCMTDQSSRENMTMRDMF